MSEERQSIATEDRRGGRILTLRWRDCIENTYVRTQQTIKAGTKQLRSIVLSNSRSKSR